MLRISRLSDYAIVVMTYAAHRAADEPRPARQFADDSRLPLPTVSKLLKLLTTAGLLTSQRGAGGGYRLARPASDISIVAVIEAIEGPIELTDCCGESTRATCEIDSSCPVSDNWKRINAVVRDALASLSLSEMAVPIDCSLAHLRRPGVGDRLILHALRTTG